LASGINSIRDAVGAPVYSRYANIECELPENSSAASARLFHHDSFILSLPPEQPVLRDTGVPLLSISGCLAES
jgi:hypothetical protein